MNEATNQIVISAPAVDIARLARAIAKEHAALQDDERNADAHEKKSLSFREAAARRRVELGRMLIEAKRGIKHGGWLPYLEKLGIPQRSANDWMRLAGWAEEKLATDTNAANLNLDAPTLADAGIDKRPRKTAPRDEQPDPPAPREQHRATTSDGNQAPSIDIDRELSRIQDKLCAAAASMPKSVRKQIAHELRHTAQIIEEMS